MTKGKRGPMLCASDANELAVEFVGATGILGVYQPGEREVATRVCENGNVETKNVGEPYEGAVIHSQMGRMRVAADQWFAAARRFLEQRRLDEANGLE